MWLIPASIGLIWLFFLVHQDKKYIYKKKSLTVSKPLNLPNQQEENYKDLS